MSDPTREQESARGAEADRDRLAEELGRCESEVQVLRARVADLARGKEGDTAALRERAETAEALLAAAGEALGTLLADSGTIGWKPVVWVGEPGSSITSATGFVAAAQARSALSAPALTRAVELDAARREVCKAWGRYWSDAAEDSREVDAAYDRLRALEAQP